MAIAVASGCPPLAGIITSIGGGLLTGFLGGAKFSIKGAPAGLIVIVLAAVNEFANTGDAAAGYRAAIAIGAVAGMIQVLIGAFKLGKLIDYIPAAVVHGMISAIGFIVIAKQIYTLLGIQAGSGSPLELLIQVFGKLTSANPIIASIGIISVTIMMLSLLPQLKHVFKVPGALLVLVFAIAASWLLDISNAHTYQVFGNEYPLAPKSLIHLPESLIHGIVTPDWSALKNVASIQYIFLFAVIGSIESLLTVKALNKAKPANEQMDLNKDLVSLGIANTLVSLVGGIPMISEIGRSKANIDLGARNSWSNFTHGALLLLAICFFAGILDLVPLTALAGILVVIGYRLLSVPEWKHAWHLGWQTFAVYFTTFLLTITVDLLAGVMCGFVLYLVFEGIKCSSVKRIFWPNYEIHEKDEHSVISCSHKLIYTNFPHVKKITERQLVKSKSVLIDCIKCTHIEKEFVDELETFIQSNTQSNIQFLRGA